MCSSVGVVRFGVKCYHRSVFVKNPMNITFDRSRCVLCVKGSAEIYFIYSTYKKKVPDRRMSRLIFFFSLTHLWGGCGSYKRSQVSLTNAKCHCNGSTSPLFTVSFETSEQNKDPNLTKRLILLIVRKLAGYCCYSITVLHFFKLQFYLWHLKWGNIRCISQHKTNHPLFTHSTGAKLNHIHICNH